MEAIDSIFLRYRWLIGGQVQGVGFRPFVFRIATEAGLSGFVQNSAGGVVIEAQGDRDALRQFGNRLVDEAPSLAHIRTWRSERVGVDSAATVFRIIQSAINAKPSVGITADMATCDECARELRDSTRFRHFKYPLVNCTSCGPRFSIVRNIPYDRANTTMADFGLCPDCQAEYDNPLDRRFHAQPVACHHCGPRLELVDRHRNRFETVDPIAEAALRLIEGQIVAIKGIGGYHLACLADRDASVQRLRQLKHRATKPLAVMARHVEVAEQLLQLSAAGRSALVSPAAPIVIARRRNGFGLVCAAVAPRTDRLGVMVAYTPIQHLIFDAINSDVPLVMTSANDGDQPIVFDDQDAIIQLGGMCDAILRHNRPIQRPVDDSIVLDVAPLQPLPIRRARGYVPSPIELPETSRFPGVAVGAELKSTLCLVRGDEAILSQHLGDLANTSTFNHFTRTYADFCRLFDVEPTWIAHDLHPSYLSTHFARGLAKANPEPIRLIGIQHHHAHAAAVLAEHRMTATAIAVIADGAGYGLDNTVWGGEVLLADLCRFERVAHLSPILLPGSDASARHPWRSAAALLRHAFGPDFASHPAAAIVRERIDPILEEMLRSGRGCIASSSVGRVFDGVAALLGLCMTNTYEAEAPQTLEATACNSDDRMEWECDCLDTAMLVRYVVDDLARQVDVPTIALRFHRTLARMFVRAAVEVSRASGLRTVALSGGAMCNAIFVGELTQRLEAERLVVLVHCQVPPNDGGIAYGQAAVAVARNQAAGM